MYHRAMGTITYHAVERALDEISYVRERGVKTFRLTDANFLSDEDFALAFMNGLIERKIDMSFWMEVIPLYLSEEMGRKMAEYIKFSPDNRITVGLGLQSINTAALKRIKRNISRDRFDKSFEALMSAGVVIKTDIILGLPLETKKSYIELIEYVAEKMRYGNNYFSVGLLRLLPGSDLEKIWHEEKLTLDERTNEHFVYETPTFARQDLVECQRLNIFAHRIFSTIDNLDLQGVRNRYFEAIESSGMSHYELLSRIIEAFSEYTALQNHPIFDPDLLYPELCNRLVFDDIANEDIMIVLDALSERQRSMHG
jgi:radical SAM superfamily enzyme YgiQ (UPF0313 family)